MKSLAIIILALTGLMFVPSASAQYAAPPEFTCAPPHPCTTPEGRELYMNEIIAQECAGVGGPAHVPGAPTYCYSSQTTGRVVGPPNSSGDRDYEDYVVKPQDPDPVDSFIGAGTYPGGGGDSGPSEPEN